MEKEGKEIKENTNDKKEVLKFENVSLTYHTKDGETLALKDINFSVYEKEFVAIVGPSGCGKTTILSLIAGILQPSTGHIYLDGQDINEKKKSKDVDIGYMFQRDQLFDWRTIWKNVTIGIEIQKKKKDTELLNRVSNLIDKYGLGNFKNSKPTELSGGMRQRVALIRTLALNPKILLLDEPFSALDFQTRLNVCDNVSEIISNEKKTAVLVTHDISEAVSMADRVIILSTRPGTVKKIVEIDLKEYGSPLKRRESKKAHDYFDEIWKELVIYDNG
ncbi:MAG: ABC transporter ATP-binding protein [Firmicutes bacterium]|nr:ABC transporter ATP-binding protein [Bacillota bacterium]